jgi:NDP-sugar pyrophosphorylase family protein
VGYLDHCIREYLSKLNTGLSIEFVCNPKYDTTNNIYSLWAARSAIQEPFLLVESDLVVDAALLEGMMYPGMIGVSRILPWMNGTTVSVDSSHCVTGFHMGGCLTPDETTFKTVNIYSLSLPMWRRFAKRLDQYVSAGRVDGYYEAVFAEMMADGSLLFDAVFFDNERWYEIDTVEDLHQAERLFSKVQSRSHRPIQQQIVPSINLRSIRGDVGRDKHVPGTP